MTLFFILVSLTIIQRMVELRIAKRNTRILIQNGAREFGGGHYWVLVTLHSLFFLSLIAEALVLRPHSPPIWPIFFLFFLTAQIVRVWVIRTLNGRWTTRILVLPEAPLVESGPFRFFPHPNYVVVAIEIATLPMIFGLSYTAAVFTVLNAIVLLGIRIPEETRALEWAKKALGSRK